MDTKFFEERNFWEKELRVEVPDVPGAEEAFEEIENLLNGKDGRQAAAKAEKAIEAYGEAEGFLLCWPMHSSFLAALEKRSKPWKN